MCILFRSTHVGSEGFDRLKDFNVFFKHTTPSLRTARIVYFRLQECPHHLWTGAQSALMDDRIPCWLAA